MLRPRKTAAARPQAKAGTASPSSSVIQLIALDAILATLFGQFEEIDEAESDELSPGIL